MTAPPPDMSQTFALKSALRKSMLRQLKTLPDELVEQQCERIVHVAVKVAAAVRCLGWGARSVACYLSMAHGELRTNGIVSEVLRRGTPLFIPYLPPPSSSSSTSSSTHSPSAVAPQIATPARPVPHEMRMLRLYSPEDMQRCPLDNWGILDPGEYRRDVPEEQHERREDVSLTEAALDGTAPDLDLILLPGVAFDEECNRLGRGKAYYDRFLASYTSSRKSPLLGKWSFVSPPFALALSPQLLPSGDKVPTTDTDFQLDGVLSPSGLVWRQGREPER
ncbi:5,10-methenyltetrahydrofolate synthetase [Saitozyma podzolica]|uniref:5-formyltetrahydrofolate cyclo-ligase n=1 Tax=Saitozyma podzolica TaxID=1890683 RepID=A0A427XYZ5_9TREE|nr:5,10-methenyltetrahydrofolate synthetase [Saitozyma podzolica]